ncbi:LOW QUALITY PROTEIN: reverse transcriptase [Phytophthora megakarya]|uniref:Reverse transcriptase n=1 Tax=Phytophthora megakarya TaxID=4795 RepID=A0A225W8A8_9STRA|nr:LOW QUALITY PROTEIN: reverse transcriptase [Phytophthora megakarya]
MDCLATTRLDNSYRWECYLEATTVNLAEYSGMKNGVQAALDIGATDLVLVGNSRLAIQQSLGLIAGTKGVAYDPTQPPPRARWCPTEVSQENKASSVISIEPKLAQLRSLKHIQEDIYAPIPEALADEPSISIAQSQGHTKPSQRSGTVPEPCRKKFFDFKREEANGVPTEDSVRLEAELSRVAVPNCDTPVLPDAEDVDPLTAQRERRIRIATAQVEEFRWANLKTVLHGDESTLTYRAARDAWKMSDHFVLSEDNVLYFVGTRPLRSDQQQEDAMLRLVLPTTMIPEILQNCHDSLEGGHQCIARTFYKVKLDYYLIGLYADVARHVQSCPDCSSSKSRPKIREYSPGNILAERSFQVVTMDFVIPLPKFRGGAFTVPKRIHRPLADTTALRVAQAFEECVYQPFGAPSLISHDKDPRFMSEVFQSFTEMMQSRSRATLSYRPQVNDQQERSVKTVMQSVRVYAEDLQQQDWDEIAEKLIFAINNSMDTKRKETPVFLVHGWDAQSKL